MFEHPWITLYQNGGTAHRPNTSPVQHPPQLLGAAEAAAPLEQRTPAGDQAREGPLHLLPGPFTALWPFGWEKKELCRLQSNGEVRLPGPRLTPGDTKTHFK